jgi:Protein of unknown function (DUF2523)
MDGIAKWLADISWPIVSRVLTAMGVGTVTYTGLNTAVDGVIASAQSALTGMLPVVVQIAARAGFFDYLSITSGGLVSGLTWMVLKNFALKTGGA